MWKAVVYIPTEELYTQLQLYLFSKGYIWNGYGMRPRRYSRDEDCIRIVPERMELKHADRKWYEEKGYEILDIGDFINLYLPEIEEK